MMMMMIVPYAVRCRAAQASRLPQLHRGGNDRLGRTLRQGRCLCDMRLQSHVFSQNFQRIVPGMLRPNHSASILTLSGLGLDLGLMASGLGFIEIGLVASNIYSSHDIN